MKLFLLPDNDVSRFISTGITITALNFALYSLFVFAFSIQPDFSAGLAFILLIPFHYLAYSKYVFLHNKIDAANLVKYVLFLVFSYYLSFYTVKIYWNVFHLDPIPSQLLSLILVISANYVLLKYVVFPTNSFSGRLNASGAINAIIILGSFLLFYYSVFHIFAFTHSILYSDDWRHFYDYFFEKNLLEAIFDRQNGHLMILPNLIFLFNYKVLNGVMSNLAIVNVGLLSIAGMISAGVAYRASISSGKDNFFSIALASVIFAGFFLLAAPVTLFWGMGVHNHLVVLGVSIAALAASGLLGKVDRTAVIIVFLLGAITASMSFSTGAAVWGLGFVGSLIQRVSLKFVAGYFVIGMVAALFSLGLLDGGSGEPINVSDVGELFWHVVMFPAGSVANYMLPLGDSGQLKILGAKCAGVLIWVQYFSVSYFIIEAFFRKKNNTHQHALVFFWLIASFGLLAGALVGIGRLEEYGLDIALSPRFSTWSWLIIGALWGCGYILLLNRELQTQIGWLRIALPAIMGGTIALLLFLNMHIVDKHIRYIHNYFTSQITEIAVNSDQRPTQTIFWRRQDLWIGVVNRLKSNNMNIFNELWPHTMGQVLESVGNVDGRECNGFIQFKPTSRGDEWITTGWSRSRQAIMYPVTTIYFVDEHDVVVGFARPAFGHTRNVPDGYFSNAHWFARILQSTGIPVLSDLPGVSGWWRGRVRLDIAETSRIEDLVRIFGEDRQGNICSVKT